MSPPNAIDANFPVKFISPMAGDLLVGSMAGTEQMSRLFVFNLDLLSENPELHFDNVVGQQVTTSLALDDEERYFNGYITEFSYAGKKGRFFSYRATVRPWFWFLTRTADCRIFQKKTVPEIIREVFGDNGMGDFEERLTATYRQWEYCVQYRESDFNFISRLMEQEGIYYFFEHQEEKHVLVMADTTASLIPFPGFSRVKFHAPYGSVVEVFEDHLDAWMPTQFIVPTKYAVQDFNFTTPRVNLLSKSPQADNKHTYPLGDPEIFDYPGEYPEPGNGMDYAEIRLEELQCKHERVMAGGPCRGLAAGCLFALEEYPREDQNKDYVVLSVTHDINNMPFISGEGNEGELYRCQTEVMDQARPFRAARETPKPLVQGPQTAIVVGKAGEEIFTDEYGRVKVQFHWDRYGKSDENSSCWVRVSQAWAGAKWGGIHIPRIGQEVIISFVEGDPDRPVITGRVYNADCMPPYALEANKTQSGIKSHSTKGGGPDNFNEIRMEDKINEEELYIQAEKNENILVKNDKTETVGHDETIHIRNDRDETVDHDETITVKNDRTESVEHNEKLNVGNDRTRTVGKNETISVGGARSHTVDKDESIKILKDQEINVGATHSVTVGKNRSVDVGKDHTITVAGGEKHEVGKKLVISAGSSILLECGAASISMKKNGDIKIGGKNLVLSASSKISGKASGTVKLKGATILEN